MNTNVRLSDIAGYEEVKQEASKVIEVLKNYDTYKAMGAYLPKGLILAGNPGVGKTMLAKAIATESNVPLFEFESNESESETETIKSIKGLFTKAKQNAPAIVFIDELDELVMTPSFVSDYSRKIAKILLTEIDGISSSDGVLVIATTNYRGELLPSLIRSGRMDKKITLEMPDFNSREAIFKLYLTKNDSLKDLDTEVLASKTNGFSGADIKTLINETIIDCASRKKKAITLEDFERNIPVVRFQNIKKNNEEGPDDLVCYHEIGHFLAEYKITGTIGSISTEQYGEVKGFVSFDDFPKTELISKKKLKNELITALGGMAGEEVLYGDVSNGSEEDVQNAYRLAKSLVIVGAYGFDKVMARNRGISSSSISEEKLQLVEHQISELLAKAYEEAKTILSTNKELADIIYIKLKKKVNLSSNELKEMIDKYENGGD